MLELTFEESAEEYRLPKGGHDALCISQLGQGGASSGVERSVVTRMPDNRKRSQLSALVLLSSCRRVARAAGKVMAVKRLSLLHRIDFQFLLENEVSGLTYANLCNIPRVITFTWAPILNPRRRKELIFLPDGDARMMIE